LYRNEEPDYPMGGEDAAAKLEVFAQSQAMSISLVCAKLRPLLKSKCKLESLNAGRYVGVAQGEAVSDEDFKEKPETLNEELEVLNSEALELQTRIAQNIALLLN
ncbi:MAG: hypothetical protein L0H37_09535, partial [Nitrosospira sp.]|nr:hypothetical protein [Nitrosospira sp.]